MHNSGFVQDLAMVLGVAAITGLFFRLLKLPSVLGYLVAGLIVGPYLPVPLFADRERVHTLSEFGVVLVMFAVGLEFRIRKFVSLLPISGFTAVIEIGALFAMGYLTARFLGWGETSALFLGACLSISSTMAVSKILEQRPIAKESRDLVFGVLVLQDVAAIALIAVMTAIARGAEASFLEVLTTLGKLVATLLGIIAVGMFLVPRFVRVLERTKSQETLIVGAIGVCFSLALLAEKLGYSAALGAFLAGILVAESGRGPKVEHLTASMRDVFAAVFFVSVGMTVDPRAAWASFPTALLVLLVVILTQFVGVTLGGVLSGSGLKRSVTAGLSLGQIGEFAFILSAIGLSARVVRPELRAILVTVAVLSTFTTSLLLRLEEPIYRSIERAVPAKLLRLLSLYESWLETLRNSSPTPQQGVRRYVRGIIIDLLFMGVLVLAFRAFEKELGHFLAQAFGLGARRERWLALSALVLCLIPALVPLVYFAHRTSSALAERLFGPGQSAGRAVLEGVLALSGVLCVGIPVILILGPIIGTYYVWPALALAVLVASLVVWRRASRFEADLSSGGLVMLRAIVDLGLPEVSRQSMTALPGYANLREVALGESSYASHKTLAQLNVRFLTGASIVAIRGPNEESLHLPSAHELLRPGDTVVVAGRHTAQEAAVHLLLYGVSVPSTAPSAAPPPPSLDVD